MLRYVASRCGQALLVLWAAFTLSLGLLQALPGDAIQIKFQSPDMGLSPAQIAEIRASYGQHHFHEDEGGMSAPLVFLSHVAARTERIRLGTGTVTLPVEQPIRVAEDAAVLNAMSGGRLELGVGSGGTVSAFAAFDLDREDRGMVLGRHLRSLRAALAGEALSGDDNRLYPASASLADRL